MTRVRLRAYFLSRGNAKRIGAIASLAIWRVSVVSTLSGESADGTIGEAIEESTFPFWSWVAFGLITGRGPLTPLQYSKPLSNSSNFAFALSPFTSQLLYTKLLSCHPRLMNKSELSEYFRKIGRKGGKARLETMTKEERRRIASLGGSASKGKPKKLAKKRGSGSGS